jgi:hypothetical protein
MNIENYHQWYNMKKAMLKGLHCVLCGDEYPTQLHHFKPIADYKSSYEYWNDETQIPVCVSCHAGKLHILSKGKLNDKTGVTWKKCVGGGFDVG